MPRVDGCKKGWHESGKVCWTYSKRDYTSETYDLWIVAVFEWNHLKTDVDFAPVEKGLQPVWIKLDYRWVTGQISKRLPARHVGPKPREDGFRFHWRDKGHCASCLLLLLRRLRTGSSPHWLCGTENCSVLGMRSLLQDGFSLLVLRLLCIPMCRTHDMLQSTESILLLCGGIRSATRWWSALHGQHVLPELLPQNRLLHEAWRYEAQGDAVGLGIYHWLDFPRPNQISACKYLVAFRSKAHFGDSKPQGF